MFGEPVFRYGVDQAIMDNWLVDYDPITISSNVRINGVFLKEGEQVGRIDTQTGVEALDNLEDERTFDASAVEHAVTAPDSNRKNRNVETVGILFNIGIAAKLAERSFTSKTNLAPSVGSSKHRQTCEQASDWSGTRLAKPSDRNEHRHPNPPSETAGYRLHILV
jgi:hypothetical protein